MRRYLAAGGAIALVIAAFGGYGLLRWHYTSSVLRRAAGVSLTGSVNVHVGEPFDFGVQFVSAERERSLTMRGATLMHPLPSHVHLIHEAIVAGGGFTAARGWPPQSRTGRFPTSPIDGYRVAPGAGATAVLALEADRPGTYLVGPVALHLDVPGPLGLSFSTAQETSAYALLCVRVPLTVCEAAQRAGPTERGFHPS